MLLYESSGDILWLLIDIGIDHLLRTSNVDADLQGVYLQIRRVIIARLVNLG